jgi:hypothetical protein
VVFGHPNTALPPNLLKKQDFISYRIAKKPLGNIAFIIYKISSLKMHDRDLAQLVERHPYKVDVIGSIPVVPTNCQPNVDLPD